MEDPDVQVAALIRSAGVISTGVSGFSLSQLDQLAGALWASRRALRRDHKEDAMRALAPAVVPTLAKKFLRQLQTSRQLNRLLEVLQSMAEVQPESVALLELTSVKEDFAAALVRCGSDDGESGQLWARLQATCASDANILRDVVRRQAQENAVDPGELPDPSEIGILPLMEELLNPSRQLRPNRTGAWADDESELYRHIHYMLYREELLAPLRESVASFFDSHGAATPAMVRRILGGSARQGQQCNFFAYPDTRAVQISASASHQPMVQLKFGMGNRRVDFSLGSHLIYGSLVILFQADAQQHPLPDTAVYATVEEFDLRTVERSHTVGVCILDEDGWQRFSVTKKYVMVESPGYFHAVHPVLKWLRDQTRLRSLTLRHDLLTGDRRARVAYLQGARIDLSCLYKRDLQPRHHWKSCDPLGLWPDPDDVELDESQQDAMRHILSCSVPLVQGPPGTGKSYIGVKAVQLIRQALDKKGYTEPIVLICLTNHALDQFLEDLLDLFPGRLIRFGGRTKSEDQRLLDCLVMHHMRSSKEEYEERMKLQEKVAGRVKDLDRLRQFIGTLKGQARLMLGAMPRPALARILNALGEDVLDAGLFLSTSGGGQQQNRSALQFITDAVWWWADGEALSQVQKEAAQWLPHDPRPDPVQMSNAFAALDDEPLEAEWAHILNSTDRAIANTAHHGALGDWDAYDEEPSSNGEEGEEEEFDEDEVDAVLNDRLEARPDRGDAHGRSGHRDGVPAGADVSAGLWSQHARAVAARAEVYELVKQWEIKVAKTLRGLREAEADAEEEAGTRRNCSPQDREKLRRSKVQPWERLANQLRRGAEGKRSMWRRAKEEARAAVIDSALEEQSRQLEHVLPGFTAHACHGLVPPDIGWATPKSQRQRALQAVSDAAAEAAQDKFQEGFQQAQRYSEVLGQMKKRGQLAACRRAAVVGMTSTFAALNQDLLERMGSRVVVVEEAGELLECQLMACLSSPNLEQLILIGDHQQLRPKVNTFELCRKMHLDISLFERLVAQRCERAQLTMQLRMQPDVSDLVRPFYVRIDDHERVTRYPPVPGVADTIYWVTHDRYEDNVGKAQSLSKYSAHEATFACRLAKHLVLNGMDKGRVTILTPYLGQKREIKKHLPHELQTSWEACGAALGEGDESDGEPPKGKGKRKGKQGRGCEGKGKGKGKGGGAHFGQRVVPGVRVVTIDDYQGEENDAIILSLVRSNPQGKLGFCSIENRIIVALSRARHGMYILGNVEMFRPDDRWFKVLSKLEAKNRIGPKLNLRCRKHPQDDGLVSCVEDFKRVALHGGCHRPCDSMLPCCGHHCPLRCHPFDAEHRDVVCVAPCVRPRPAGCGHRCKHLCKECPGKQPQDVCPTPCQQPVTADLPCGHDQAEPCHRVQDPASLPGIECRTVVSIQLECGHAREASCHKAGAHRSGQETLQCTFKDKVQAACGHEVWRRCCTVEACKRYCQKTIIGCGHPCGRKCSEEHDHQHCPQPCEERLHCGHQCQNRCGEAHTSLCDEACSRACTHGHRCPKRCFEACVPCQEPCQWRCPHFQCGRLCCEPCDRPRCEEPCSLMLDCGHVCRGVCGEPCVRCVLCHAQDEMCPLSLEKLTAVPGKLYQLECGHIFDLKMLDMYMATAQESGGHTAIQAKCCPTCRAPVHQAPRYQKEVKHQLGLIDAVKREQERKRSTPLSDEERRDVDRAMGQGRSGAGHWFACPNRHPYFIGDCGGAMQESVCPECGAHVGGSSHRLRQDNQYISNFTNDGHTPPAWPGVAA